MCPCTFISVFSCHIPIVWALYTVLGSTREVEAKVPTLREQPVLKDITGQSCEKSQQSGAAVNTKKAQKGTRVGTRAFCSNDTRSDLPREAL